MRALVVTVALGVVLVTGVAPGYSFQIPGIFVSKSSQELNTFKLIHVADLKTLIGDSNSHVHIYDANVPETREKYGVIPGATLLTSDDEYPLSVLPHSKNAKLVFYCANTHCSASHEAARRAVKAGYEDVSVMADGITGWKAAGEPTVSPSDAQAQNS